MDVLAFLNRLQSRREYRGQTCAVRALEAREAQYAAPETPLPEAVQRLLRTERIEQLYSHQAEAYDCALGGENVVIATGTASGKSLCYHLPVFAELTANPHARALYLYPAKALAYDQLGNLERMVAAAGLGEQIRPACYDGDTPKHRRPGIRRSANLLLSNPDMLHVGILPYVGGWAGLLANLRYVVLDEIHMYRGIFGSHVANVIRRLQRVCRHFGASPQFICCSATVGNPRELAERLTRRPMHLIDQDGSPRGRRWVVLWNPPWLDEATRIARRSGNVEAQWIMQELLEAGAGTIAFAKARVVAELLYKYVREGLQRRRPELVRKLQPYRGGYLPTERREIEKALFSGELLGVCSTNALELGIDVGALDAALIVGFPSTLCSLWQQAGRAGRRQSESVAIFIAYDDPVDQYLMRRPEFVFERPLEQAVIDPENPYILAAQLACAAAELPVEQADLREFGETAGEIAAALAEEGRLAERGEAFHYAQPGLPQHETNLRTISNATFHIVDVTQGRNEVIGQVDSISAPELIYPEAVYLHQGESYLVRALDYEAREARVERIDADYYTQPVLADECRIVRERLAGDVCGGRRFFGDVTVRWQTVAFRKFKFQTMELIGQTKLDLPPQQINTAGCWLTPPAAALERLRSGGHAVWEALSGVRNLLCVALPTLAMCDRYDIGGVVNSSELGVMAIILYDRYEGGVGYTRHGYERAEALFELARELVSGCDCENGCPGCVGPPNLRVAIHHDPDVGQGYKIPDKGATIALLEGWLGR